MHKTSGKCVNQNEDASISAVDCGQVENRQVICMPVGVDIDYSKRGVVDNGDCVL